MMVGDVYSNGGALRRIVAIEGDKIYFKREDYPREGPVWVHLTQVEGFVSSMTWVLVLAGDPRLCVPEGL